MDVGYFLDTYALYEMMGANPAYDNYADRDNRTCILNIAEIYYRVLLDSNERVADERSIPLFPFALPLKPSTIKAAMLFKFKNRQKNLSYIDCIGYALAREHNLKFLTGDKEFKDMPNVEFVK